MGQPELSIAQRRKRTLQLGEGLSGDPATNVLHYP